MSETCLFCAIIAGQQAAQRVYENDAVVVIRDIHPQAPVHYLVMPKKHVASLNEAEPQTLVDTLAAAQELARRDGFAEPGYRTVFNVGKDGGQTVGHLHLHVLAGRPLTWPPG
jgi:histidine triad (HIT) family protein